MNSENEESLVEICLEIPIDSLIFAMGGLSNEELIRVIKEVDIRQADFDFTKELVSNLVNSLAPCFETKEEFLSFIKELEHMYDYE